MGIFIPLLSLLPIVLPFLNLWHVVRKLECFYSNRKNMKIFEDFCNTSLKNNLQWNKLTAKAVTKEMENAHYLRYASRNRSKFIDSYRKTYHAIILYCVFILTSAVVWIFALGLNILLHEKVHLEFTSVLLLYGFGVTWKIGVAPLLNAFQLWGWLPEKIDIFTYNIIGPYGKLAMTLPKITVRLAILPINAIVFASFAYYASAFLMRYLSVDFFMFIIIFWTYQYVVCPIYAFITYYLTKKRREQKRKIVLSLEYYRAVIKNNTYFLFLIIYIFIKYMQIFEIDEYWVSMVEAIGIIFLFDTYLQQNRNIDSMEKKRALPQNRRLLLKGYKIKGIRR